jgi:hypothetical protein
MPALVKNERFHIQFSLALGLDWVRDGQLGFERLGKRQFGAALGF